MNQRTLRITSVEGLMSLDGYLKLGGQAPFRLILALPGLPPDLRAEAETSLARTLSACGCTEGAVGLLAALPVGAAVAMMVLPAASGSLAWAVCIGAGGVIGAMAGKVAGRLRARRRLAREVERILSATLPLATKRAVVTEAA